MVKFLSGTSYDGSQVPVCTYWSLASNTNPLEDFAELESEATSGRCIANHFFARDDISCFNDGFCNNEGKCLPCTKYKYGEGMRMGISHSPPLEFFRQFSKGLTDADLVSPQLEAGGAPVTSVSHSQLPFHILIRNIQAEIAKCCHWTVGDGLASQFVITPIINGPDQIQITGANGGSSVLNGIRVTNDSFPQDKGTDTNPEGGSFFPVGLTVVAGWSDVPSFYLEPRTGLVKDGEGIVFISSSDGSTINSQARSIAAGVPSATNGALSSIDFCLQQSATLTNAAGDFFNNLVSSSAPVETIISAQQELIAASAANTAVNDAKTAAIPLAAASDAAASIVVSSTDSDTTSTQSAITADQLELLAQQVDIANQNCGGQPASDESAAQSRRLRSLSQSLRFSGQGGFTKCDLVFTDNNPAAQWNSPLDGSLPCNGIRTDCPFYTGATWNHATTEKMEIGQKITAEAIQEVRFRSDDWSRFPDPEEEFNNRFSVPFIWAFKDFVNIGGTPAIEDMILYRPTTLFARSKSNFNAPDDNPTTLLAAYETMRVEKVRISNFNDLSIQKTISRILPGQEDLNSEFSTPYASIIKPFNVPVATRLNITHPPTGDTPFIYRSWTPEFTNRVSLFGSASPFQSIYIVNNTALRNRDRYHQFHETSNLFNIPSGGLPGASTGFVNEPSASVLLDIFQAMEKEKSSSQSLSVLGFDTVTSSETGFWESRVEVDLVHNAINEIFVFILLDQQRFIFDSVQVDYRFLHSIMKQDTFEGKDFTINDKGGKSILGIATGDLVAKGEITASPSQIFGSETVTLDYGYYAWRFKDRGLRFSTLTAGTDLQSGNNSVSGDDTSFVTETDANSFITNVTYRVVQYRNTETISNWYLLQDCGLIMAAIDDVNVNRVLPLSDQKGVFKALSPVLVNNGATGSVIAQWAPEEVTLNIGGENKNLILIYRNEDGIGLPANYAIYGPDIGAENLFGRPNPETDTLTIQYTYLRAQTHQKEDSDTQTSPEGEGDVVDENFYGDQLRTHNHSVNISSAGLVAGGSRPNAIRFDQQDYVFVFKDSEGRPIGKKNVRFMVSYYNLACVSIEIFYAWRSDCMTYGLFPDLFLATGGSNGQVSVAPKASVNPEDFILGHRVAGLLGPSVCSQTPNCGDHEILSIGRLRKEFETITATTEGEGDDAVTTLTAVYPSAGQSFDAGSVTSSEAPGTIFLRKVGTLWYPYIICEKPRYYKTMEGPGNTDTTELINSNGAGAGVASGNFGAGTFSPGVGNQGGLPPSSDEAYRIYDQVVGKVLDVHPSLKACTSGYTYGNTVTLGGGSFSGYARRRGEIDQFWYETAGWAAPPFGNFGRPVLMCEIAMKIGDYTPKKDQVAFRWMPMFPEREDMGATSGLFGESLEPINLRLVGSVNPLGGIAETAPTDQSSRYTHKSLITNRGGAGIEYPYAPYYPTFLPDGVIGSEPESQGVAVGQPAPQGTISTAWAWREADRPIRRAQGNTNAIIGMKFLLPGYILDNRRMEVRLRPAEGNYQISYSAPEYDIAGALTKNAEIQLGDGPPREIIIDFINRAFGPAPMPDTVYDTSKILGEPPFDCSIQASSNRQLTNLCGCDGAIADLPEQDPALLPAIFAHGDSLAPGGYVSLYARTDMETAFPQDIQRSDLTKPCCLCNYFIEQIYFNLTATSLPVDPSFDPSRTNSLSMQYTWSRVPHGIGGGLAQDNTFAGQENLAQNYVDTQGLLLTRPFSDQRSLSKNLISAYFPSPLEATQTEIEVPGPLSSGDSKLLGGSPVIGGLSTGQGERIVLDILVDAYTSIKAVHINFLAGEGLEVPGVSLVGIPPQNRVGDFVTTRVGNFLGFSNSAAQGREVPNPDRRFSFGNIRDGEVLFQTSIFPAYGDLPFWDQYYQEFHLVFEPRSELLSMGIHSIELEVDSLTATIVETIFIPERRYYTSSFSPSGANNPEENLVGTDSCTAYWRNTSTGANSGGNRFRSYSWGSKLDGESGVGQGGGQPTIAGDVKDLEQLQRVEYNLARNLFNSPYTYSYSSFFPLDEQRWIDFLGGNSSSWTTTTSVSVSSLETISNQDGTLLYGEVPNRSTWNGPGHAWTHDFEEDYNACCEGCGQSQVIKYNFLHLHDGLAVVETAGFWPDFESGGYDDLLRLPSTGGTRRINEDEFRDQNGNPISADVLNASGFRKDADTGELLLTGYTDA